MIIVPRAFPGIAVVVLSLGGAILAGATDRPGPDRGGSRPVEVELACSVQVGTPQLFTVNGNDCQYFSTSSTTPILAWTDVDGEAGYEWQVWSGIECTGTLVASGNEPADATAPAVPPILPDDATYHWRVRALGDGTTTCPSPWRCGCPFTVGSPACGSSTRSYMLNVPTTWTVAGSPYLATGITITSTGSLTVEPGVAIKLTPAAAISVAGRLELNGTPEAPIVITTLYDDSACGPSPGTGPFPSAGDWGSLRLTGTATAQLSDVIVRFATAGLDLVDSVQVDGERLSIAQSITGLSVTGSARIGLTGLDLVNAPLVLGGRSETVVVGANLDGGGSLDSAGTISFGASGSGILRALFSGVTVGNMKPIYGRPALDLVGGGGSWVASAEIGGLPLWVRTNRSDAFTVGSAQSAEILGSTLFVSPVSWPAVSVSGRLDLGRPGSPVEIRSAAASPVAGDWPGVRYQGTASGTIVETTVRGGAVGLELASTGEISVSDSRFESNVVGLRTSAGAPTITRVEFVESPLEIRESSRPTFTDGTWDGGGVLASAGWLRYGESLSSTPDPRFSGIEIRNMAPGGREALDIGFYPSYASSIWGPTLWEGIPFFVGSNFSIGPAARVEARNTTILFAKGTSGYAVWVYGVLDLGAPGAPVELRSSEASPSGLDWGGFRFMAGSSGTIRNATFRHALVAIRTDTTGPVSVSDTVFDNCRTGVDSLNSSSPTVTNSQFLESILQINGQSAPRFTNVTFDGRGVTRSVGYVHFAGWLCPKPVFENVTVSGMSPTGWNALEVISTPSISVTCATAWKGIPIYLHSPATVTSTGSLVVEDTTLLFPPGGELDVDSGGYLALGSPTGPVELRSGAATPGDWSGVRFLPGSSGSVDSATIRHAATALEIQSAEPIAVRNSVVTDATVAGLSVTGSGVARVEGTSFDALPVAVVATATGEPSDLGGGALGSNGGNSLLGADWGLRNESPNSVFAQGNWWGCRATLEMEAGMPNISTIWDRADAPRRGVVRYENWLGGGSRAVAALADTAGGRRDVLLSWPSEPTGTLRVLRGDGPQSLTEVGTTIGASWRDVGGLDLPGPLVCWAVEGPCPERLSSPPPD